jgi:hypothetical protein
MRNWAVRGAVQPQALVLRTCECVDQGAALVPTLSPRVSPVPPARASFRRLFGSADTCSGHCSLRVPEVGIHVCLPLGCLAAQRLPLPLRKVPQSLPAAHLPIPCASVPSTCAIGVLETHRLARVMKGGVLESLPFFSLLLHPCRSLHVTSLLQGPRKLQTIRVRQFDPRSWMEELVH